MIDSPAPRDTLTQVMPYQLAYDPLFVSIPTEELEDQFAYLTLF